MRIAIILFSLLLDAESSNSLSQREGKDPREHNDQVSPKTKDLRKPGATRHSRNQCVHAEKIKFASQVSRRLQASPAKKEFLWSSLAGWEGRQALPGESDPLVEVKSAWRVTLDIDTPVLQHLKVYGTLVFLDSPGGVTLNAKIVEIMEGGSLEIGTRERQYTNQAGIVLHGGKSDRQTAIGPGLGNVGKALIVRGSVQMNGVAKTPFRFLSESLHPGDQSIRRNESTWTVGDHLAISSSKKQAQQMETLRIESVSNDSFVLSKSVEHFHFGDSLGIVKEASRGTIEDRARVLNLTRNISISASKAEEWGCAIVLVGPPSDADADAPSTRDIFLENVEIEGCGQSENILPAVSLLNLKAAASGNPHLIQNSSIVDSPGQAVGFSQVSGFTFRGNNILNCRKKGIELAGARDVSIAENHILGVGPSEGVSGQRQISPNFGVHVLDDLRFHESNVSLKSNFVGSVGSFGVGFWTPGLSCSLAVIAQNNPNFQGNAASSCDVGWFGQGLVSENCVIFSHFTAFKNRQYGFLAVELVPEVRARLLTLHGNSVGAAVNSGATDPDAFGQIFLENSAFYDRIRPSVPELYDEAAECNATGVYTGIFNARKLLFPLSQNSFPLHKWTSDESLFKGRQTISNSIFEDFGDQSNCQGDSVAIRVNDFHLNMPSNVVISQVSFVSTAQENRISFPEARRYPSASAYCGSRLCWGNLNTIVFDLTGSVKGDGVGGTYFGLEQKKENGCGFIPAGNVAECPDSFGLLRVQAFGSVNAGDLFPMTITAESLYIDQVETFSNEIEGLAESGGVVKLGVTNRLRFHNHPRADLLFQLSSLDENDWAMFKVEFAENSFVNLLKDGARLNPKVLSGQELSQLSEKDLQCGAHVFDLGESTLHFTLTGSADCKLRVTFENALRTSLRLDVSLREFKEEGGKDKTLGFLYTSLDWNPQDALVQLVKMSGSTILDFFLVWEANRNSKKLTWEGLKGAYCALHAEIGKTPLVGEWDIVDSLGMITFFFEGQAEDLVYLTCNDNPFNAPPCLEESPQGECYSCKSGFDLELENRKCLTQNCRIMAEGAFECKECEPGFWLDSAVDNFCRRQKVVEHCVDYLKQTKGCQTCVSPFYPDSEGCSRVQLIVEHCKYYESQTSCKKCTNYFALNSDECVPGQVANCREYLFPQSCQFCEPNFFLQGPRTCVQYSPNENCVTFNPFKDECIACREFFLLDGGMKCVPIENCRDFNNDNTSCVECSPGFFLSLELNRCVSRQARGCDRVKVIEDVCETCEKGFWMDRAGALCLEYSRVPGCLAYRQFEDACSVCNSGKQLSGNRCISEENVVPNCAVQDSSLECLECRAGYDLDRGKNQCVLKEKGGASQIDSTKIIIIIFLVLALMALVFLLILMIVNRKGCFSKLCRKKKKKTFSPPEYKKTPNESQSKSSILKKSNLFSYYETRSQEPNKSEGDKTEFTLKNIFYTMGDHPHDSSKSSHFSEKMNSSNWPKPQDEMTFMDKKSN